MTTQYSPILKLALPVQGELSGTWGDVVNDNITSMVEQAIAGRAVINTWTTNSHTLTSANGTTSESRCAMLELTDTGTALSGAGTVVCPTASKIYIVKNAAGQNITVKTSGGTGILVPNGRTTFLFCDGTNVVEALTHTTSLQLGTSTTVTAVLDEDNMASNSATSLATQQSIKAYVDAQVGANNELSEVLANGNTTGGTDIVVSANDVISLDDGTNALPSLTTTGDLNTGLYFPAADEVGITTGGTQRVKVDSTGVNVTGVTTAATFEPNGDTSAGDNAAIGYTAAEGLILTGQGSTNDVTIKNDADADVLEIPTGTTNVTIVGNLGVGGNVTATGTSVFASLDISGDIDVDGTTNLDATNIVGALDVTGTITSDGLTVDTNTLHVDATNNRVGIGTDSPSAPLHLVGSALVGVNDFGAYDKDDANLLISNGNNGTSILLHDGSGAYHSGLVKYDTNVMSLGLNNSNDTNSILTSKALNITSTGVGIGVTPQTDWTATITALQIGPQSVFRAGATEYTDATFMGTNVKQISGTNKYIETGAATEYYQQGGVHFWNYAASGTAGNTISFSEAMRIASDGSVGIGTSSPSSYLATKLVIGCADEQGMTLAATSSSTKQNIYFADGTSGSARNRGNVSYDHNLDQLSMGTASGSLRLVMDSSGNVGIGTSSPQGVLDLGASSSGRSLTFAKYNNIFGSYSEGSLNLTSNYYGDTTANAYKTSSTATYGAAGIEISGTGGTSTSGLIQFFVDAAASKTADAAFVPSERMRIDSSGDLTVKGGRIFVNESDNGNTAIGLTRDADEGYVQVYSAGSITTSIRGNGDSYFNGGNVGIGTDSPDGSDWNASSTLLHLYQNSTNGALLKLESSNTSVVMAAGNNQLQLGTIEAQPFNFYTSGTERMRISSDGDLELIQSNNLYWKHQGGGTIRAGITADSSDNLTFSTGSSDSTAMTIDGSGRVGIGSAPNSGWRNDIADQIVLMLGTEATLFSDAGVTTALINNAKINNGDAFVNISTRGASQYFQYEGAHKWYTAASASAGSNINTEMTSPKMTLDISGNLLVGKTALGIGTAGHMLAADGYTEFTRTATSTSTGSALNVGRNSHDGTLATFWKDGSAVGSIGTNSGYLKINSGNTSFGSGIEFHNLKALPVGANGASSNGTVSLGESGRAWKDLYLSGSVAANAQKSIVNQPTGGTAGNYWKLGNWTNVGGGDSLHIEVHSTQGYSNSAYSAGTTVIEYTRTNSGTYANAVEGVYYSTSANAVPSVHDVVYVPVGGFTEYEIYVKAQSFAELAPFAKANGDSYFVPNIVNTESTNRPNGSYANMSTTLYHYIGNASNDTTSPTRIGFTSSGNIRMASGAGIDFSATANGSGTTTSELLDDYEEGTWTPNIGSGASGGTFNHRQGFYRKVGRVVHFEFDISPTGWTANGDHFYISDLPFPSLNTVYAYGFGVINYQTQFLSDALTGEVSLHVGSGLTTLKLYYADGNPLPGNAATVNQRLIVSGRYFTA